MNIAFYAPLKPPNHPIPSGDRQIARNLIAALRQLGHSVHVASEARAFEGDGDLSRQQELKSAAKKSGEQYIQAVQNGETPRPNLWFTYHLYHKAPDWIGPSTAAKFGIPYVIAEASIATRQADGPWQNGYDASIVSVAAADLIFGLNPRDKAGVKPNMKPGAHYYSLPAFIDTGPFRDTGARRYERRRRLSHAHGVDDSEPWVISVAMMRKGDKTESYMLLADALEQLNKAPWHLFVVGDGEARSAIMTRFSQLEGRVTWLGHVTSDDMPHVYSAMDLMIWPAINEALGMTFLEAGASGIPSVAGYTDGVASIVRDHETGLLTPSGDATAFATAIRNLLQNPARRSQMAATAAQHIQAWHSLGAASNVIGSALNELRTVAR